MDVWVGARMGAAAYPARQGWQWAPCSRRRLGQMGRTNKCGERPGEGAVQKYSRHINWMSCTRKGKESGVYLGQGNLAQKGVAKVRCGSSMYRNLL